MAWPSSLTRRVPASNAAGFFPDSERTPNAMRIMLHVAMDTEKTNQMVLEVGLSRLG
jgi:hypothetical protein